jgi:hypothetical protein
MPLDQGGWTDDPWAEDRWSDGPRTRTAWADDPADEPWSDRRWADEPDPRPAGDPPAGETFWERPARVVPMPLVASAVVALFIGVAGVGVWVTSASGSIQPIRVVNVPAPSLPPS